MTDFNPQEVDDVLDQAMPLPSEKLAPGSEAPASATVHVWDKDNFGVLFTIRDTNAKNLYVRMNGLIQTLKNDGWKPDWRTQGSSVLVPTKSAVVGQSTTSQTGETPLCGIHGTPMTLKPAGVSKTTNRPYPAFWSCGQRDGDQYCKYKPGK